MTYRAVEILGSASLILAEDTRHSRPLLRHYAINTGVRSYHEHNEARETPDLVKRMQAGDTIAIISDAGTPLLSDPGARLVAAAAEAGIPVIPIPGASALLAAVTGAAFPLDRFTYHGFLPRKGKQRSALLSQIAASESVSVLYEAPGRVSATLADIAAAGAPEKRAVVARELTKQFEEFARGTVSELSKRYEDKAPRGEVVIVVDGMEAETPSAEDFEEAAAALRATGTSPREAMERLMAEHRAPRNIAYRLAHEKATLHDDATGETKKVTNTNGQ